MTTLTQRSVATCVQSLQRARSNMRGANSAQSSVQRARQAPYAACTRALVARSCACPVLARPSSVLVRGHPPLWPCHPSPKGGVGELPRHLLHHRPLHLPCTCRPPVAHLPLHLPLRLSSPCRPTIPAVHLPSHHTSCPPSVPPYQLSTSCPPATPPATPPTTPHGVPHATPSATPCAILGSGHIRKWPY